MHFAFTEEQQEIRDAVRGALEGECTPEVVRRAWEDAVPALWTTFAELGVFAVELPEDLGGLGGHPVDWILVVEETGRAAFPGPIAETFAALPFLVSAGQAELAARVGSGEARISLVEPSGYAVDADLAEAVLVVHPDRVSLIRSPTLTRQHSVDGARRIFSVEGDAEPLEGDVQGLRDRAALATAAQLLGTGRRVLDMAVAYAKERRQFGRPIGAFQAVQHHLVDARLRLDFAAPPVYRAAWSLGSGDFEASAHVSMARVFAAEAAELAVRKALQVHGANGYTTEFDLHLWMKRVWAQRAAWGSAADHTDAFATSILEI